MSRDDAALGAGGFEMRIDSLAWGAQRLSRDNEAAHECRHEWVLSTIANSGP